VLVLVLLTRRWRVLTRRRGKLPVSLTLLPLLPLLLALPVPLTLTLLLPLTLPLTLGLTPHLVLTLTLTLLQALHHCEHLRREVVLLLGM